MNVVSSFDKARHNRVNISPWDATMTRLNGFSPLPELLLRIQRVI